MENPNQLTDIKSWHIRSNFVLSINQLQNIEPLKDLLASKGINFAQHQCDFKPVSDDFDYYSHIKQRAQGLETTALKALSFATHLSQKAKEQIKVAIANLKPKSKLFTPDNENASSDKKRRSIFLNKIDKTPLESLSKLYQDYKTLLLKHVNIDSKDFDEWFDKVDQYTLIKNGRPGLVTVSKHQLFKNCDDSFYVVQIEKPQSALTDKTAKEFLDIASFYRFMNGQYQIPEQHPDQAPTFFNLPAWFYKMPHHERLLLNDLIQDCDTLEKIKNRLVGLPSKTRNIPGLNNLSISESVVLDKDFQPIAMLDSIRASHLAARGSLEYQEQDIKQDITKQNILRVIELGKTLKKDTSLVLLQTLVSPSILGDKAGMPDKKLDDLKKEAVIALTDECPNHKLLHTNYALNIGRHGEKTFHNDELPDRKHLITAVREYLYPTTDPNTKPEKDKHLKANDSLLNNLLLAYKKSSNKKDAKNFYKTPGYELHLACIEMLMAYKMNTTAYSACVSGKDRRALLAIMMLSQLAYYQRYQTLHHYDDKDENHQTFAHIFAEIYLTLHQQKNANQNAHGAVGIKTPSDYLPDYLIKAINCRLEVLCKSNQLVDYFVEQRKMSQSHTDDLLASIIDISYIKKQFDAKPALQPTTAPQTIDNKPRWRPSSKDLSISLNQDQEDFVLLNSPSDKIANQLAIQIGNIVQLPCWKRLSKTIESMKPVLKKHQQEMGINTIHVLSNMVIKRQYKPTRTLAAEIFFFYLEQLALLEQDDPRLEQMLKIFQALPNRIESLLAENSVESEIKSMSLENQNSPNHSVINQINSAPLLNLHN